MYVILPLTFVSFDICINEFLAIGISPFFLIAVFFPVSKCIGTCLRTYCRDRHQPRRATSEIAGNFISTRLSPNTSASSRAWLDAIAKYTEHKRSLCDGCISLSSAEGLVSGVSACYFMPVSGLFPFLWFLTFKVFFILFTGSCLQISHFCVNKLL